MTLERIEHILEELTQKISACNYDNYRLLEYLDYPQGEEKLNEDCKPHRSHSNLLPKIWEHINELDNQINFMKGNSVKLEGIIRNNVEVVQQSENLKVPRTR